MHAHWIMDYVDTRPPYMEGIKCCNHDECKTPKASPGYSPSKLMSVAPNASLEPSQPSMATLLQIAWEAKRLKLAKRNGLRTEAAPLKTAAVQPVVKPSDISQDPLLSGLLSRRLGKETTMAVQIPARNPFPPPLAPSG